MLTVEDYGPLRRAHRDGMSIREIARTFHHSRRKVREALARPEPEPYTRAKDPPAPKLGAFHATIKAILVADEQAPRKQRHTAAQIFRRLRDEHGYTGGYDQVRRYVGRHRREQRETFIPLIHDPGQRLECDFGHIYADFPNGRRQVPVLMPTWAYSYCPFALALPTERVEAILHGMVEAFAFFGCVPQPAVVDKYQTAAFDTNRSSVPRHCAFRAVTVKAYVDHIEIIADGQITARHDRGYDRGRQILDPIHYLVTLERRPAALDHAGVYRNWRLPAVFTRLRETLEQRHGPAAGARQYIRVLQLLATHPVGRVEQAMARGEPDAELIRLRTERLARRSNPANPAAIPDPLAHVQVPPEDLSRFDLYLTHLAQGELAHV